MKMKPAKSQAGQPAPDEEGTCKLYRAKMHPCRTIASSSSSSSSSYTFTESLPGPRILWSDLTRNTRAPHFTPQHWLFCHMGWYKFEFDWVGFMPYVAQASSAVLFCHSMGNRLWPHRGGGGWRGGARQPAGPAALRRLPAAAGSGVPSARAGELRLRRAWRRHAARLRKRDPRSGQGGGGRGPGRGL